MCSTAEAFSMFVAVLFRYQLFKNIRVYQIQELTKNTSIFHATGCVFVISI